MCGVAWIPLPSAAQPRPAPSPAPQNPAPLAGTVPTFCTETRDYLTLPKCVWVLFCRSQGASPGLSQLKLLPLHIPPSPAFATGPVPGCLGSIPAGSGHKSCPSTQVRPLPVGASLHSACLFVCLFFRRRRICVQN